MVRRPFVLIVCAACVAGDVPDGDPAPTDTTAEPTAPDTAPPTIAPGDTDTAPVPDTPTTRPWEALEVDCSAILPLPATYEVFDWVDGAEDFTFDDEGYQIAVSGGNLYRTPFGGPPEVLVPNLGDVRGTRFLPDDTLVLALIEEQAILNLDPTDGSRAIIGAALTIPNGIAVGVDGKAYVATQEKIVRVDPATAGVETVADMPGNSFDGLVFSPDFTRLYFNEELGQIHWIDLAPDGTPSAPFDGPTIPLPPFGLLDGMAVDACGNLYVTEMSGTVWRVDTAGNVEVVVELGEAFAVIPALNFGSGIGGWEPTTLYVLDFKGKLYALDIGVPGKWEPHLPVP